MKKLFTIILLSFITFGVRAQNLPKHIEISFDDVNPRLIEIRPDKIIHKRNKVIVIYSKYSFGLLQKQMGLNREWKTRKNRFELQKNKRNLIQRRELKHRSNKR